MGNLSLFNSKRIVMVLCMVMPLFCWAEKPTQTGKPNIIFILVDDLRWDAMGFTGQYPFLETPHIDRLRKEGVHFENAFVTHSLCAPSRATFLTGTFSYVHGVTTNQEGREFNPDKTPSFAQILKAHGYKTAFIGKWHMGEGSYPRPEFDYWCSFAGQGKYYSNILNINGDRISNDGYITDELNRYALEFVENNARKEHPFLLYLSHKAVHEPFIPNEKYAGLYSEDLIPEPASWKDDLSSKPQWQRMQPTKQQRRRYRDQDLDKVKIIEKRVPGPWNAKTGRGRQKNYLRCLSAVDEGVGKIYELLKEKAILENTVIVFAGDNGFFHGEHGRGDKRLAYNESMRIPLLMRFPPLAQPGTTVSEFILNADIAPTFLNIAEIPASPVMQGKTFVPLLQGENIKWRESFLYTYWPDLKQFIPRIVALRTHRYLYATYPDIDDIDELYDLKNDPFEINNLAEDPSYAKLKGKLRKELEELKKEKGYRKKVPRPDPVPDHNLRSGLLLHLDFNKLTDSSFSSNNIKVNNVTRTLLATRPYGEFSKNSGVIVNHHPDFEASLGKMIIECVIQPHAADGIIASSGSKKNGWTLFLESGRPGIVVAHNSRTQFADSDSEISDKHFSHLVAVIGNHSNLLKLYVNGRLVGEKQIFIPLSKFGKESYISVGMDEGEKIDPPRSNFQFQGLIKYLKLYRDTTPSIIPSILDERQSN